MVEKLGTIYSKLESNCQILINPTQVIFYILLYCIFILYIIIFLSMESRIFFNLNFYSIEVISMMIQTHGTIADTVGQIFSELGHFEQ